MERRLHRVAERGRIIGLRDSGMSVRNIARTLGITPRTALRWIHRWEGSGDLRNLPGGRPQRCTTPAQDQAIIAAAEDTPHTNAVAIRDELHLDASVWTVRRRLHEAGLHHRVPAAKERLTQQHREGRLHFAREYVNRGDEFWSRCIWTDEKTFSSTSHGQLHCWRRNNTRYERQNVYEVARSGHQTVNVWGWISLHGMGDIHEIEGRFNAVKYVTILNDFFLPSFHNRNHPFPPGTVYFVHDRCPVHQARVVQDWFDQHPQFQLLPWPSKGADCNPIENIWGTMVNSWEPGMERTREQLMNHTREVWDMYRARPALVRSHTANMPRRLQAVIERDGGWTGY